jgi:hypothetical protein
MIINKKYAISILFVFLVTVAMICAVETVTAAKYKTIDSGKKVFIEENGTAISQWKTISNGKVIKSKFKLYGKNSEMKKHVLVLHTDMTIKKISKTKVICTVVSYKTVGAPYTKKTIPIKTRSSSLSWYYKEIRPMYLNPTLDFSD